MNGWSIYDTFTYPTRRLGLIEDTTVNSLLKTRHGLSVKQIIYSVICICIYYSQSSPANELGEKTWQFCPSGQFKPERPLYSDPDSIEFGSTEIRAQSSRVVQDGPSQFQGNVEVIKNSQSIRAEVVTYDKDTGIYNAEGRAHLWDKGMVWTGDAIKFDSQNETALLSDGKYWLGEGPGRGTASKIVHNSAEDISVFKNVEYTTCPVTSEAWRLHASALRVDHSNERASASNAIVRFMDVPVFYMPYVNFPTTKQRKSGFLAPVFGTSNESGFDTQLPYYWNIAPNQDATISPRIIQDRGIMLDGEYRYLNPTYSGTINGEYLSGDDDRGNQDRSYLSVEHHQLFFDNRGRLNLLFNNVSDNEYFKDFGNTMGASSQSFLERKLEFAYEKEGTRFYAVTQDYQTLVDDLPAAARPYKILPRLELGHIFKTDNGFEAAIKSDASYFYKSQSLSSIRATAAPSLAYSYRKPYLQIIPKIVVAHTEYFNDDPNDIYDDESRTVPIISIDATLFAERNFSLWGKNLFQTLEPRVYYLYVPKVNQDNLPIFDTGAMDINTHTMYLPHRFSGGYTQFGGDRVGDANRVTFGVSSRLSHKDTGRQIMSISIGQVFHLDRREITLPGQTYSNNTLSNLFAEGELNLSSTTKITGSLVWEPESQKTERKAISFNYQPDQNTILKAAYRFTRAPNSSSQNIEQVDTSFRLPVPTFKNMSLIGMWSYTIHDKTTLEAFGGVEYDSCCWSVSIVGQRYLNGTNISSEPEFITGVFVQLRLRGLMGLGKGRDPIISRHLPESRSPFN